MSLISVDFDFSYQLIWAKLKDWTWNKEPQKKSQRKRIIAILKNKKSGRNLNISMIIYEQWTMVFFADDHERYHKRCHSKELSTPLQKTKTGIRLVDSNTCSSQLKEVCKVKKIHKPELNSCRGSKKLKMNDEKETQRLCARQIKSTSQRWIVGEF